MTSGSEVKLCADVAPYAENNMPTAIRPSAKDLFTAVDFPAAFIAFFLFFSITVETIDNWSLKVAGPSPSLVGNR